VSEKPKKEFRKRDVSKQDGVGDRRYKRYCDAFDWVIHCIATNHYLEAIAILDSLLSDRLASRLHYVRECNLNLKDGDSNASEVDVNALWATGWLCGCLLGDESKKNNKKNKSGPDKDFDKDFREIIGKIEDWVEKRNKAIHDSAKVFRESDSSKTFAGVLLMHKETAECGLKLLKAFDELDTKSRAKGNKKPASSPNAFFPERGYRWKLPSPPPQGSADCDSRLSTGRAGSALHTSLEIPGRE
jgi:hypothetical protein